MNKALAYALENYTSMSESFARNIRLAKLAVDYAAKLNLEDDCRVEGSYGSVTFRPVSRADVEKIMSIIPAGQFWRKETVGESIQYSFWSEYDTCTFYIYVTDSALPPTCHVEEIEVEVPAQPARMVKKKVVKCNTPSQNTPDTPDQQEEATAAADAEQV
jgi:hypothetical protein